MYIRLRTILLLTIALLSPGWLSAATEPEKEENKTIVTFWPLVDYRANPATKSSKLSILGPLLTFETTSDDRISSFRPLFHTTTDKTSTSSSSYYLFPLASSETTPDVSRFEFLQLFQKNVFRKSEPAEEERQFMLFPFIITGDSKKYGSYTAIFPLYGDLYERFYRDEHHFVLFPLYSRTVKKGTTNYNFLWPFFSVTKGEKESGFQVWPLYGQASKEGVYNSRFSLWPIYSQEERGLDTETPSRRFNLFPLYGSFDSPAVTSRTFLWPFFGYFTDKKENEEGRDYLWPLWLTVTGEKRNIIRLLPFYSDERTTDTTKNWYLWPLYRSDSMQSTHYRQERKRILYFLFTDRLESWAVDNKSRRRSAFWPLYVYNRDTDDNMSLTIPAPVEPILDKDGIEKLWAPLWRVYVQQWNSRGESSLSLFWNFYWQESSPESVGVELFPLFRYRSAPHFSEVQIIKGLVNYNENNGQKSLSLLWLPFGFKWETKSDTGTVSMNRP